MRFNINQFYLFYLLVTVISVSAKSLNSKSQPIASEIVQNQKSRFKDAWGAGLFGSSREERIHLGLDIEVKTGESIFAPFGGTIVRESVPYKDDLSYRGVLLKGSGLWDKYEMKVFYVEGLLSGTVAEKQVIGFAQDITLRYPEITNHIHVQITYNGKIIDPFEIWQMSF